jgi:hypothetical protein
MDTQRRGGGAIAESATWERGCDDGVQDGANCRRTWGLSTSASSAVIRKQISPNYVRSELLNNTDETTLFSNANTSPTQIKLLYFTYISSMMIY